MFPVTGIMITSTKGSNEMNNHLELNGQKWKVLIGQQAKDSKDNFLGVITDQYVDEGKMVFLIDDNKPSVTAGKSRTFVLL